MTTERSLPQRFLAHVKATRLFRDTGEAIVAVSGGPDSVSLLDLLCGAGKDLGLNLVVAHVAQAIHASAPAVGQAAGNLATHYALPCETTALQPVSAATDAAAGRPR